MGPEPSPLDLQRSEQFLGEQCRWFDLMPGESDVGHTQCLTIDGIPLKETVADGWGDGSDTRAAVSFVRRPVDLKEMLPPAELLDPKKWGF